jgi:hypothetical protein
MPVHQEHLRSVAGLMGARAASRRPRPTAGHDLDPPDLLRCLDVQPSSCALATLRVPVAEVGYSDTAGIDVLGPVPGARDDRASHVDQCEVAVL